LLCEKRDDGIDRLAPSSTKNFGSTPIDRTVSSNEFTEQQSLRQIAAALNNERTDGRSKGP
jgi:hypothetical protein